MFPAIFTDLQTILSNADATMGAAECHGFICGLLCAGGQLDQTRLLAQVFEDANPADPLVEQAQTNVQALATDIMSALNDSNLEFELLLPDEDGPLDVRIDALGLWCQGFLLGLGIGGMNVDTDLPEIITEFIQDTAEIAKVGFDMDEGGDEDEAAYMEIVEYLRVGVLLANEELQQLKAPPQLQ